MILLPLIKAAVPGALPGSWITMPVEQALLEWLLSWAPPLHPLLGNSLDEVGIHSFTAYPVQHRNAFPVILSQPGELILQWESYESFPAAGHSASFSKADDLLHHAN